MKLRRRVTAPSKRRGRTISSRACGARPPAPRRPPPTMVRAHSHTVLAHRHGAHASLTQPHWTSCHLYRALNCVRRPSQYTRQLSPGWKSVIATLNLSRAVTFATLTLFSLGVSRVTSVISQRGPGSLREENCKPLRRAYSRRSSTSSCCRSGAAQSHPCALLPMTPTGVAPREPPTTVAAISAKVLENHCIG